MKNRRSSCLAKTVKTAALVGAPLLLAESELHAAIIYVNTPQTFTANQDWSFNSGGFHFGEVFRPSGSHLFGSWSYYLSFTKTAGNAVPLSLGATIGSSRTFGDFANFPASSSAAYYGFRFPNSNLHYGWAQISTGAGPSLTIHAFAFETTVGAPINAGQTTPVPEPADFAAGLGALAIGAAAVIRRRQKEKAARAA